MDSFIPASTPCAGCAKPIGTNGWQMHESGRVYHQGCTPREMPEPERKQETLTEHAERAAHNIIHGPGQGTLEEAE